MANWNPYENQFSANAQARYYEAERDRLMKAQQELRESKLQELYNLSGVSLQEQAMNILGQRVTEPPRHRPQAALGDSIDAMRYGIQKMKASTYNGESMLQQYVATTEEGGFYKCNSCGSIKCNGERNNKGRCRGKQEEFNHKLHMLHSARLAKKKV